MRKRNEVRKIVLLFALLANSLALYAQNEVGPEGDKLLIFILALVIILVLFFLLLKKKSGSKKNNQPLIKKRKIKIELGKDALYYPDNLELIVRNTGNTDLDLDKPLLILDNFWLKRKFRLKGMDNRTFYPLYLEKGKTHQLKIDLNRFYSHDKSLKKFPKAKITVFDVKGKRLGSKSVYLRKTLFKF